ncbi:hypothetical protein NQ318_016993 [Aromia moschata]|uniref:DUF4817 domain-containing protein n=1 Tax=Aromia moschata TaxID=1265417 RepID=A0AAV8YBS4_9CUCU|nr:hypothetical protein NQ318_016993 [Aromia moschata]
MRDILCVYSKKNFNGRRAHRRYLETYSNRRQPDFKIFKNLYDRLGETGSFRPKRDSAGRPNTLNPEQEEEILVRVAENSELSTRHIAMETGVSKSTVWKVLKKEGLHPYHFTPVQNLIQVSHVPVTLNLGKLGLSYIFLE